MTEGGAYAGLEIASATMPQTYEYDRHEMFAHNRGRHQYTYEATLTHHRRYNVTGCRLWSNTLDIQ